MSSHPLGCCLAGRDTAPVTVWEPAYLVEKQNRERKSKRCPLRLLAARVFSMTVSSPLEAGLGGWGRSGQPLPSRAEAPGPASPRPGTLPTSASHLEGCGGLQWNHLLPPPLAALPLGLQPGRAALPPARHPAAASPGSRERAPSRAERRRL